MLPIDPRNALADNVKRLTERLDPRPPRPELAARMGIGDKTLGSIRAGTGNPTLNNLISVANFFRMPTWQLLKPDDDSRAARLEALRAMATPRSQAALDAINQAANENRLTEDDLLLLQKIAQRFMGE